MFILAAQSTLKCIREVTEGRGNVRLGLPCRSFVSEMLLGKTTPDAVEEFAASFSDVDGTSFLSLVVVVVVVVAALVGMPESCMRTEITHQ